PDREPGAGPVPPADTARAALRPGGPGRADPARSDPGEVRATLHSPPAGTRAGLLRAPRARVDPAPDAGGPDLPGAGDVDRDDARRLHRGGGGRAAPHDGAPEEAASSP